MKHFIIGFVAGIAVLLLGTSFWLSMTNQSDVRWYLMMRDFPDARFERRMDQSLGGWVNNKNSNIYNEFETKDGAAYVLQLLPLLPSQSFTQTDIDAVCLNVGRNNQSYSIGFRLHDEAFERLTDHLESTVQESGYSLPFTVTDYLGLSFGGGRITFASLQDLRSARRKNPKGFRMISEFYHPFTSGTFNSLWRLGKDKLLQPCLGDEDLPLLRDWILTTIGDEGLNVFSNSAEIRAAR